MALERSSGFSQGAEGSVRRSATVEVATRQPQLVIDLNNDEVTLDGHQYQPGRTTVLVLFALWKAGGVFCSRPDISAQHPELKNEGHPERPIKRLWKERLALGSVFEQNKRGFYRLRPEYMANVQVLLPSPVAVEKLGVTAVRKETP